MPIYIVGDIQGCCNTLKALLAIVDFDRNKDQLWGLGDLVNRGKNSLDTLNFLYDLGSSFKTVLGNHDLHFMAVYYKQKKAKKSDTFEALLSAPETPRLCDWLRKTPLLIVDSEYKTILVHAGIPHIWDLKTLTNNAQEIADALQGPQYEGFLANLYGDQPKTWQAELKGWKRLRIITNYFTRMRLINQQGKLNLKYKGPIENGLPSRFFPWFNQHHPDLDGYSVLFGHWAALNGQTLGPWATNLDTGCVWGKNLTMMRLDDKRIFQHQCLESDVI